MYIKLIRSRRVIRVIDENKEVDINKYELITIWWVFRIHLMVLYSSQKRHFTPHALLYMYKIPPTLTMLTPTARGSTLDVTI